MIIRKVLILPAFAILITVLLFLPHDTLAAPTNEPKGHAKIPVVEIHEYTNLSKKIHPKIMDELNRTAILENAKTQAQISQIKIPVYIELYPNQNPTFPQGITITGRDGDTLVATLTQDQIDKITKFDSVKSVTLPLQGNPAGVLSQGVSLTNASLLQSHGLSGQGITVAVIDYGFFLNDTLTKNNIVSSKIFDSLNVCKGNITCGMPWGYSHGTAVADTIVAMAPNVKLRLYVGGYSTVDFDNAVDDAIANHVNIITTSADFPTAGGTAGKFR